MSEEEKGLFDLKELQRVLPGVLVEPSWALAATKSEHWVVITTIRSA